MSYVKILRKMILNRIAPSIEQHLIKEQAGFRPDKSCTSQLLNLQYNINNSLRANPNKQLVTALHLRNREAKTSLKVSWNGVDLKNTTHSKYLSVTLDRTLSYKQHIQNTIMNVATSNKPLEESAITYKNNGTGPVLLNNRICCYNMG